MEAALLKQRWSLINTGLNRSCIKNEINAYLSKVSCMSNIKIISLLQPIFITTFNLKSDFINTQNSASIGLTDHPPSESTSTSEIFPLYNLTPFNISPL